MNALIHFILVTVFILIALGMFIVVLVGGWIVGTVFLWIDGMPDKESEHGLSWWRRKKL